MPKQTNAEKVLIKVLDELMPIEGNSELEDLDPFFHKGDDQLFYGKNWCMYYGRFIKSKYGKDIPLEEIRSFFRKSQHSLAWLQKLYPVTSEIPGRAFNSVDWAFILNGIYIPEHLVRKDDKDKGVDNEGFKRSILSKTTVLNNTLVGIENMITIGDIKLIKDSNLIDTGSMIRWVERMKSDALKVPEFIAEYAENKKSEEANSFNSSTKEKLICFLVCRYFSQNKEMLEADYKGKQGRLLSYASILQNEMSSFLDAPSEKSIRNALSNAQAHLPNGEESFVKKSKNIENQWKIMRLSIK
jgi:hypothetical protein